MEKSLQGTTLGRYQLDTLIGRGNRASVYQATIRGQEHPLALRIFDRELSADPSFVEQLQQLNTTLATARHPNLLPIIETGKEDGRAYIARPYVSGRSLRRLLGRPMPFAEALQLLQPVAEALDFAHRHGLVHGDLKPGNILLVRTGGVVLVDLGIAQLLPRGNSLLMAATGRYYGTPEYLAPEQVHGIGMDGRTDQYSLAVILYEALVGRPPFQAESAGETARVIAGRHILATVPLPRTLNPALSENTEETLLRALAKDPARRFPYCAAMLTMVASSNDTVSAPVERPLPAQTEEYSVNLTAPLTETAILPIDTSLASEEDQRTADLQALISAYEERVLALTNEVQERNRSVATLTEQLGAARESRAQAEARLAEMEAVAQERDALAARVKELEQARVQALHTLAGEQAAPPKQQETSKPSEAIARKLVVKDARRFGLITDNLPVRPGTMIGRHPSCAILLEDNFVSVYHARLTEEFGAWWIADLGTKNGTFVNNARITEPTRLHSGDTLRFGRVRATFV